MVSAAGTGAAGIAPAPPVDLPAVDSVPKQAPRAARAAEVVPPAHQRQDDWPQGCALAGQLILEVTLAGDPRHHAGCDQGLQPAGQHRPRHAAGGR